MKILIGSFVAFLVLCILYANANKTAKVQHSDEQSNPQNNMPKTQPPTSQSNPQNNIPKTQLNYKVFRNLDASGNDIVYHDEMSFADCPAACNNKLGCVGYVTDTSKSTGCWLKSKITNPVWGINNRDTYVLSSKLDKYISFYNTDYSNNDIGYYDNMDDNECRKLCDSSNDCVGFIRNTDKPTGCWLKNKVSSDNVYRNINNRSSHIKTSYLGTDI